MHQRGALQRVTRAFITQVVMRQPAKLVIDARKHRAQRLVVTGLAVREQPAQGVGRKFRQPAPQRGKRRVFDRTIAVRIFEVN